MMNYSLYLQGGGSMQAPMSDEQALAHKKEVDNQMAEAIKQNPASLDQAIQEYGEDAPSFIKHMIDVAAENQDEELLEILKPYAEKFNIMSFRCGGKVRAKIKKACSGKKMEKGGEAPIKKEAKGGKPCPCTLHRVGGKLIEVDCNGIPVAKNGMKIAKFQPGGNVYVGYGSNFISTDPRHSYVGEKGNFGNLGDFDYYIDRNKGNKLYARGKDGKIYMSGNTFFDKFGGGDNFHNWSEVTGDALTDEIKGYFGNNSAYATDDTGRLYRSRELAQAASTTGADNSKYNRPGGIFADTNLSDKSLAGRQQWVKDNADYLKSLGWTDDQIAGYKGSAQDNYALLDAINRQPAATYGNDLTNQQLLDYNPEAEGAQQLGAEAAARRQKLLDAQAARTQALTFNGKQYANESAYNAAVGTANQSAANKYYQDKAAADAEYAARRAQAIGYTGSNKNIIARRNAAFDNIAKWQAGQLDPQTLSLRDRNAMARQMRRSGDRTIYTMPQYGEAPQVIANYSGPAALTQEQLNATTFAKKGGIVSYRDYINWK